MLKSNRNNDSEQDTEKKKQAMYTKHWRIIVKYMIEPTWTIVILFINLVHGTE